MAFNRIIIINMLCFLLFLCSLLAEKEPLTVETGVYQRLFKAQAAVTDDLHFFVLNAAEKKFLHFGPDGRLIAEIGGPGQGPGEMQRPNRLRIMGESLFVWDVWQIHIFSTTGQYLRSQSRPEGLYQFNPCVDGWIGLTGIGPFQEKEPIQLWLFDEELGSKRVLCEWQSHYPRSALAKSKPSVFKVNPAADRTMFVLSQGGQFAYVKPGDIQSVFLFDLSSGKKTKEIKVPGKRVPFDRVWGEEIVAMMSRSSRTNRIYIKDFPEYFPLLQSLSYSAAGHLIVRKWFAPLVGLTEEQIHQRRPILVYDKLGELQEPSAIDLHANRIIALIKDVAYVVDVNKEGEYLVVGVPAERLSTYIVGHPLPEFSSDSF